MISGTVLIRSLVPVIMTQIELLIILRVTSNKLVLVKETTVSFRILEKVDMHPMEASLLVLLKTIQLGVMSKNHREDRILNKAFKLVIRP